MSATRKGIRRSTSFVKATTVTGSRFAVAGFRPDEIEIVAQQNQLSVTGKKADDKPDVQYIHRGIATRSFERRFQLADFVEVICRFSRRLAEYLAPARGARGDEASEDRDWRH